MREGCEPQARGSAQGACVPSGAGRKPCCRRRGGGGGALVEPAALAALLYADGYGYDLRKVILERTGGSIDVDVGGMYRVLRRLEDEGAVTSRWCDDEAGPRRREYELTELGVELASQWLEAMRQRQRIDELIVGLLEGGLDRFARGDGARGAGDVGDMGDGGIDDAGDRGDDDADGAGDVGDTCDGSVIGAAMRQ